MAPVTSTTRPYHVIIFGASGFTGQFVVEELARCTAEGPSGHLTWALAGRSRPRLEKVLNQAAETLSQPDLRTEVEIIVADVSEAESLAIMCKQAVVVLNCVGPYRFYGEPVVKACIENGTHCIDICGEPQFLERMQLDYHSQAVDAGVYVVGSCGVDSIPVDVVGSCGVDSIPVDVVGSCGVDSIPVDVVGSCGVDSIPVDVVGSCGVDSIPVDVVGSCGVDSIPVDVVGSCGVDSIPVDVVGSCGVDSIPVDVVGSCGVDSIPVDVVGSCGVDSIPVDVVGSCGVDSIPEDVVGSCGVDSIPVDVVGSCGVDSIPVDVVGSCGVDSIPVDVVGSCGVDSIPVDVVGSCGVDSIPVDVGILYTRDQFKGTLSAVESFLTIHTGPEGGCIHDGTWQSAVYGFADRAYLKMLRRRFGHQPLPVVGARVKNRGSLFFSKEVEQYAVPFLGSDASVVRRSQRFLYEEHQQSPVQYSAYVGIGGIGSVVKMFCGGMLFWFMVKFGLGRKLLITFPGFFSFGLFTSAGPTKKQMEGTSFSLMFYGEGYGDGLEPFPGQPNAKIITQIKGAEPGYVATPAAMVQAAITLLNEPHSLPMGGGVYSPGAAFAKTTLIDRLNRHGLKFSVKTS
ncbi:saccharopine dehydrogenase b [Hypomesus transpacificus]|uniref:saccharopine dehydrogenase b n=1 Tax=Hypomesus transpacificus TaxID=137520 RepID=UPI001F07C6D5|nr:saccharopine dehydrogenase b [Hypomesus transpacificus]